MLKELLQKTELDVQNDSLKTCFLKGAAEGLLDGLVVLGAIQLLSNIFGNKK